MWLTDGHALSFRDYKEYHTDATVKFVVKMSPEKLAQAELAGLHKVFKLQTTISTASMVCQAVLLCLHPHFYILAHFLHVFPNLYAI